MTPNAIVTIGEDLARPVRFGNALPLALIAGPCQMESRDHALECAMALKEIAAARNIGLIFKASFDKANRTSVKGARGIGMKAALPVYAEIRERTGLPVVTDGQRIGGIGVSGGSAEQDEACARAGLQALGLD